MTIKQNLDYNGSTRLAYLDLETQALQGAAELIQTLIQEISPSTSFAIEVTGEDEENLFRGYYNRTGRVATKPMLRIFPESSRQPDTTLNRHVMMTQGIRIGLTKDRANSIILHAFPYILTANAVLTTTDYQLALKLVRVLRFASADTVDFNVVLHDPKYTFPIKVQFDTDYQYPTRESIEGYSDSAYRLRFVLGVRSFDAKIEYIPNMSKIIVQPVIAGGLAHDANLIALEANQKNGEHWEPDSFAYTIDLRKKATSETID